MDCLLVYGAGFGFLGIPRVIFSTEMAADVDDQPLSDIYREHQLWLVFAAQNTFRYCASPPSGPKSFPAVPVYFGHRLYSRDTILVLPREAVLEPKAILRIETASYQRGDKLATPATQSDRKLETDVPILPPNPITPRCYERGRPHRPRSLFRSPAKKHFQASNRSLLLRLWV